MNPPMATTVPDGDGHSDDVQSPTRLGHFEVVGRLGAGGMGLVFEGRDTVLGRRVALKLLHPGRLGNPIAPARLLREAQALAKLSHRNVVTVYEIGMAGEEPFVAMELVEGETLEAWMKRPRDWRSVLDVFIAAGHGLAAVHALGLVHRDFKPSNVLIDKDGTPKLGDFGLVRPVEAPLESPASIDPESKLTETGSVMGTPAYMSPEQRLGLQVDARADQYSFAKSLSEALGAQVPAKLQPILARALADDPDERYPAMTPLLEDLSRARRGHRARWIAAGSAVAVVGALSIAWGFGRAQSAEEPCARPTDRVGKVWSTARRSALQGHLLMIDPMLGAQRFAIASSVLDRGAERWMDQHVDACQLARARRTSDSLLDRRMGCLDRALLEIDDTVRVLEKAADRTMLDDAMKAATSLPALEDCADVKALTELVPRPTNPVQRAEADALTRELTEIDVARRAGGTKTTDAEKRAIAAVGRARKLGDPETLARALRILSAVQVENEVGVTVLPMFTEAINAASTAHDDRLTADLWADYITALAAFKQLADAQTLLPAADAAIARTTSSVATQVTLLNAKAVIALAAKDLGGATAALDEAMAKLDAAGARTPGSPLRQEVIGVKDREARIYAAEGDFKAFADATREVLALSNEVYGPDHAVTMRLHFNLGIAYRRLQDDESALKEFREAASIGEARLAPSPGLANTIFGVGSTLLQMQRNEEAIPYLERATAMARATLPPGDTRLADYVGTLGGVYGNVGRYAEAKPLLDEDIAILEKPGGPPDEKLAIVYSNRGNQALMTGHCPDAFADLELSAKIYRDIARVSDAYDSLNSIAECQVVVGRYADALRTTDALLAERDLSPEQRALAHFHHGRALAFFPPHDRGLAEVRRAAEESARLGSDVFTESYEEWIAKWGRPDAPWPKMKNGAAVTTPSVEPKK